MNLSKRFFDLIKNVQEKRIDQKNLDKVKESMRKQYDEQIQQNNYWLLSLSRSWIERTDPNWILQSVKQVNALTVQDLQETEKKYFNMNNKSSFKP